MKKEVVIIGIVAFIFIIGLIFVFFQKNLTGFDILKSSVIEVFEKEIRLDITGISLAIVYPGDKKLFFISAKNSGYGSLTNCKLLFQGDYASWIVSEEVLEIPGGESKNFNFELFVPETVFIGTYQGKAEINCNEQYQKKDFDVIVSKNSEIITIDKVRHEENKLLITYNFDHAAIVGEGVAIDVWFVDETNKEVARDLDIFTLQQDGMIQRTFVLVLPESLVGNYKLYLAVDSEPEKSASQEILLGEPQATGLSIISLEQEDYHLISFAVIILIVCGMIVWIKFKHMKGK